MRTYRAGIFASMIIASLNLIYFARMNFMNFASMGTYRAGIFRKYDCTLIASSILLNRKCKSNIFRKNEFIRYRKYLFKLTSITSTEKIEFASTCRCYLLSTYMYTSTRPLHAHRQACGRTGRQANDIAFGRQRVHAATTS